ncbi:Spike glycoprotein [Bat coronavirus HKU9-4]|uniref:Spike glycoprotein n=1 Tax=Bat coronavirus HKU9-4 TaxID=424370 RepID=A3EXJ0_BCHK9|nr:Spike glycoprotein [Bat coronavirus HKU9-4]
MLLIAFILLPVVTASRPFCLGRDFDVSRVLPHNISTGSFVVNKLSTLLPDPYIAYSGQTVRQTLFVANATDTTIYPITPYKEGDRAYYYNTSLYLVSQGFFVHSYMFKNQIEGLYCQQPFGVVFGNTFEQDRIAIVIIAPDVYGRWITATPRSYTNVTILVCSNATICANPAFNRWGPAGDYLANNAFTEHDDSCFINNTMRIPYNTSRINLAFRFQDGNLLIYYSDWLPHGSLDLSAPWPLNFYTSVAVGGNLKYAQFFQSVVRNYNTPTQSLTDGNCVGDLVNLYVAPLVKRELLVQYSLAGRPINVADCALDSGEELYCVTGTFTPDAGVYSLSRYRAQTVGHVSITQQFETCDIPYAALQTPPQPIAWRRYAVSKCGFDFEAVINRLPTFELKCFGVSPARLASMCYGKVTIDVFRINVTHLANLIAGVPDAFSKYNYALPRDFYGCVHAFYVNMSSDYIIADSWPAVVIQPGGRQTDSSLVGTWLNSPAKSHCTILSCFGVAVIGLQPASGTQLVCPKQNDTTLIEDQCVTYNVYGYTGTGVFTTSNLTIPDNKLFSASATGAISAVSIHNAVYAISPCVSVPVSVGFSPNFDKVLLFNGLACKERAVAVSIPASDYWMRVRSSENDTIFDTESGCVYNAHNRTDLVVNECSLPLGNSLCLINDTASTRREASNLLTLVSFQPGIIASVKVLTPVYWVRVPTNFTLTATTEFIETTAPKITIDCARYLCGDSSRCLAVLEQYGTFCDDVNTALQRVNTMLDAAVVSLTSQLVSDIVPTENSNFDSTYNFTALMGCLGSSCNSKRSAISDLLYNKVKIADPGFMDSYQKCIDSQWGGNIRDLICTQVFNGIAVLPPIVSPGMQALYTSLLVGAVASSGYTFGITSVGVIPFATQLQFRLNGIGVTTQVLVDNQKLIASSFNNALNQIQKGFDATNSALSKIQAVINQHATQLQTLVLQLGNTFGAISSSINIIFSRLEGLEADAEVDRLISGRMVVLNTYVTQLLVQASRIKAQSDLALQKINECVKSQTLRNEFCGNGTHVLSVPQLAPNGIMFIHYSYTPTQYATVQTAAGLCFNGTGYAPRNGLFILPNNSNFWYFTQANFYNPVNISNSNTQVLESCSVNYTTVNYTILSPQEPLYNNFDEEFNKFYKNLSSVFNNTFNPGAFNFSTVELQSEIATLNEVVQQLNKSFIDLKQMNVYEQTIKWPWYVWLAMIAGLVGLALAVVMLLCMTNCCSCFKGMCSCRHCYYDEIEDVYPAVRVHNKRTA